MNLQPEQQQDLFQNSMSYQETYFRAFLQEQQRLLANNKQLIEKSVSPVVQSSPFMEMSVNQPNLSQTMNMMQNPQQMALQQLGQLYAQIGNTQPATRSFQQPHLFNQKPQARLQTTNLLSNSYNSSSATDNSSHAKVYSNKSANTPQRFDDSLWQFLQTNANAQHQFMSSTTFSSNKAASSIAIINQSNERASRIGEEKIEEAKQMELWQNLLNQQQEFQRYQLKQDNQQKQQQFASQAVMAPTTYLNQPNFSNIFNNPLSIPLLSSPQNCWLSNCSSPITRSTTMQSSIIVSNKKADIMSSFPAHFSASNLPTSTISSPHPLRSIPVSGCDGGQTTRPDYLQERKRKSPANTKERQPLEKKQKLISPIHVPKEEIEVKRKCVEIKNGTEVSVIKSTSEPSSSSHNKPTPIVEITPEQLRAMQKFLHHVHQKKTHSNEEENEDEVIFIGDYNPTNETNTTTTTPHQNSIQNANVEKEEESYNKASTKSSMNPSPSSISSPLESKTAEIAAIRNGASTSVDLDDNDEVVDVVGVEGISSSTNRCQRKAHIDFYRKIKSFRNRNEKFLECQMCQEKVDNIDANIRAHINQHSDKMLFVCKICQMGCKDQNTIYEHMKVHPVKSRQCFEDRRDMGQLIEILLSCFPKSGLKTKSTYSECLDKILSHAKINNMEEINCALCKKKVAANRTSIVKHLHAHPNFRCKKCKFISSDEFEQIHHQTEHHQNRLPNGDQSNQTPSENLSAQNRLDTVEKASLVDPGYNISLALDVLTLTLKRCFANVLSVGEENNPKSIQ